MSNRAWVTLATNDSYGLGALVLVHSLRRAGSSYPAVVLITPSVTDPMRERLAAVFAEVITVDVLDSRDSAHLALLQRPELGITFTKLHCWSLTQYEKCVFLDADTLIVQNCDELFERDELSAAPDVGWPDCFNSGVFVFVPSQDTYSRLISFAQERGSFDGGDQGLLNAFFADWARGDINKHLPFLYNVTSAAFYSYLPALQHYGQNLKIIHFIGAAKPWLQQYNWQSRSVEAPEHLKGFLQLWWDLFVGQVHTQLDAAMEPKSSVEEEAVPQPTVEIFHEPLQDNFSLYAPSLDAESEFPWHHPEVQIPEAESHQQIDMSDFYDPWQHYRGNIPSWNPGSSLGKEEPENYVWDYLQHQDSREQIWHQPYHDYRQHDTANTTRPTEDTSQAHSHYDQDHSSHHWEHDAHQHHHTHDSSQHHDHYHQHSDHHAHPQHTHHYIPSHDNHGSHHDRPSQTFDQSESFHVHTESPRVNEPHHEHDNQSRSDHFHHDHKTQKESYQSYHETSPSKEEYAHLERNEYHDHGKPYPEAHIVTSDSQNHSENRFHHHDHGNHPLQTQRHKTEVYRIHLDLKKQRRKERLMRIRAQAVACTAHTNGHMNGHDASESEDDDFIPRHPYDGFYLRHIPTIDSRGRKICMHEIPPTPVPSPPTSPSPRSLKANCSSDTSSEEYSTASECNDDDNDAQTGVAGNLARVVPGAIESQREAIDELSRRQGWEAGNIDYMGADSFANIWAKISQTLNQAPKQPSPPKKEPTPPKEPAKPAEEQSVPEEVPKAVEAPVASEDSSGKPDTPTELAKESAPITAPEVQPSAPETQQAASEPQEAAPAKTETQVPPTPKSTPEASTTPDKESAPQIEVPVVVDSPKVVESVPALTDAPKKESQVPAAPAEVPKESETTAPTTDAPKVESQASAPIEKIKPAETKVEAPITEELAKSPAETKVGAPAPAESKLEVPAPVEAIPEVPAPVEAKPEVPAPVEAKPEVPAPVEAKPEVPAPVEAKPEVAAPVEAKPEVPAPVEAPKVEAPVAAAVEATIIAETKAPATEEPKVEASVPIQESKVVPTSPVASEAPAAEVTPVKAQTSLVESTDSPPLANTPSKEEAPAVPGGKSRKVGKLQLSVPSVGDPLATPDSEHEDAASLAQSIIASELRVTAATPSPDVPSPRPPLQPQRLSVDLPEVPTPPVSLEQIGVKPKGKPTTAAQIESSIQAPAEPSTPSPSTEAPKKKVVKKVVKAAPGAAAAGDAPVPPPRKKEKKPKEK